MNLKLNLGSFNACIDRLPKGASADYPVCPGQTVFFCMSHDGDVVKTKITGDCVNIPTFEVGAVSDKEYVNDLPIASNFMASLELDILKTVHRIIEESEWGLKLKNIRIPVRHIKIFDQEGGDGCYGYAEVGVAVIV